MWGTGSQRRFLWATATTVALLGAILAVLWRFPTAELVTFHAVWLGLAVLMLRTRSPRFHSWALVGFVTGLAIIIEIADVSSGTEGVESLIEIPLDLTAFVALVVLARQHRRALEIEHDAAVTEQHRNERQRAFLANASHALRTPITVARGHAEMALHASQKPTVKLDMMVVLDELDRLTRATERILRLSVAGELDPQTLQAVDIDDLVRLTIERWRPTAPRTWLAQPGCGGTRVLGDVDELTDALDALIENALLATTANGAITVRSELEAGAVVISVIDDGHGVDPADAELLFEAFQQGPRGGRQATGGTGLGLAIVRAIAIAHGGEATIDSAAGPGTTVRIALPTAPGTSLALQEKAAGDAGGDNHLAGIV